MLTVCLTFNSEADIEAIWDALESVGSHVLFSSEDGSGMQLFAKIPENVSIESLSFAPSLISWVVQPLPEIDWEGQWALHAPGYQEGFQWIDLSAYGYLKANELVRLKPGPGFGDLSHPTTQSMLYLMVDHVENRHVIDVGCGSGILSICAHAMGARSVQGIDIDPEAVQHAKENACLNEMENFIYFSQPGALLKVENPLILMNMIWSEQEVAWNSLPDFSGDFIVSGIHLSEREAYLQSAQKKGWKLIEEKKLEEWLAFRFTNLI